MRLLTKTMTAGLAALMLALSPMVTTAQPPSKGADMWVTTPDTNFSVAELFKAIQKQTGYTMFYSNTMLNDTQKMTFGSSRVRLNDLLKEVLTPQNIDWVYKDQLIILRKKFRSRAAHGGRRS
ncbi:hypothetical protein ACQ86N_45615 [Puia sp. P3]|uniref:hypothetical protein n=1 Tax=Puia sp. P3 TaxID=3423952 RepID=UPI003D67E72A